MKINRLSLVATVGLYASMPTDIIDEVEAKFEKRQPRVELDIFRSSTEKVMEKDN